MAARESQTRPPSPVLPMFSRISMPRLRVRRFRERSSFPGSLRSLMEFYVAQDPFRYSRERFIWFRIIQHPCYVMNYSDRSRYSINYHRSYLGLYFHWQTVRHVFFKLTESRAAVESPPHKRAQRAEANPGQLQACSNWIPIWEDTGIPGITNDCFR